MKNKTAVYDLVKNPSDHKQYANSLGLQSIERRSQQAISYRQLQIGVLERQSAVPGFVEIRIRNNKRTAKFISDVDLLQYGVCQSVLSMFNGTGDFKGWGKISICGRFIFWFQCGIDGGRPQDTLIILRGKEIIHIPPRALGNVQNVPSGALVAYWCHEANKRPAPKRKLVAHAVKPITVENPQLLLNVLQNAQIGQSRDKFINFLSHYIFYVEEKWGTLSSDDRHFHREAFRVMASKGFLSDEIKCGISLKSGQIAEEDDRPDSYPDSARCSYSES